MTLAKIPFGAIGADTLTAEQWAGFASRAFALGMRDGGGSNGRPRDGHSVIASLAFPRSLRRLHREQVRHVYGAGFTIGRAHRALQAGNP